MLEPNALPDAAVLKRVHDDEMRALPGLKWRVTTQRVAETQRRNAKCHPDLDGLRRPCGRNLPVQQLALFARDVHVGMRIQELVPPLFALCPNAERPRPPDEGLCCTASSSSFCPISIVKFGDPGGDRRVLGVRRNSSENYLQQGCRSYLDRARFVAPCLDGSNAPWFAESGQSSVLSSTYRLHRT